MTTRKLSTVVHGHACVIAGTTYRFQVGWTAAKPLAHPALPRVLLQVHVTVQDQPRNTPVAVLVVMAPLQHPAQVPLLLTDGLHERLHGPSKTLSTFTQSAAGPDVSGVTAGSSAS